MYRSIDNRVMTLDERIRKDVEERLAGKEISAAKALAPVVAKMKSSDATSGFSTKGLPGYFCGDRNAQTIVVNLNPGMDAKLADDLWSDKTKEFDNTTTDAFINDLLTYSINFGLKDANRFDEFDVKQAAFLTRWKNSGIDLPQEPDWNDREVTCKNAKRNVLSQKLQLELIPYASAKFEIVKDKKKRELFLPYIDTLLEEIFSKPRLYVIFASAIFEDLFKLYNRSNNSQTIVIPREDKKVQLKEGGRNARFKVIEIHYNENKQKALIAHTFPSQGLNWAFDLMQKYGKACYDEFIKIP